MHGRHNKTLSALIGLTAIAFIAMVVFNGLGGAGYKGTSVRQLKNKDKSKPKTNCIMFIHLNE